MEIITIILLILLGVVLLLVEFLLIPGISIAGIGCLLSFGASVFFAFKYFGNLIGFIVLLSILIIVPLFIYFLFKGKAMKPMMLNTDIDGKVKNVEEGQIQPGDEGITIGRLAPAGKAKINGITLEVRSNGQFIDQQTKIKVLKIEGNSVYVEPINE
jgi:membrane-bound ClpP family serine protease